MDNLQKEKKKVGIGTLSLVTALIGVSAYSYGNREPVSVLERFLNLFGIYGISKIVSLMSLVLSIFIGIKYKKDFAAKFGVGLSIFVLVIILIAASLSYLK